MTPEARMLGYVLIYLGIVVIIALALLVWGFRAVLL
jgi:hypothetical protein